MRTAEYNRYAMRKKALSHAWLNIIIVSILLMFIQSCQTMKSYTVEYSTSTLNVSAKMTSPSLLSQMRGFSLPLKIAVNEKTSISVYPLFVQLELSSSSEIVIDPYKSISLCVDPIIYFPTPVNFLQDTPQLSSLDLTPEGNLTIGSAARKLNLIFLMKTNNQNASYLLLIVVNGKVVQLEL